MSVEISNFGLDKFALTNIPIARVAVMHCHFNKEIAMGELLKFVEE